MLCLNCTCERLCERCLRVRHERRRHLCGGKPRRRENVFRRNVSRSRRRRGGCFRKTPSALQASACASVASFPPSPPPSLAPLLSCPPPSEPPSGTTWRLNAFMSAACHRQVRGKRLRERRDTKLPLLRSHRLPRRHHRATHVHARRHATCFLMFLRNLPAKTGGGMSCGCLLLP